MNRPAPGNSATIYALRDPRNGDIRYVGITSRPLTSRLSAHVCEAKKALNTVSHRLRWIRSLLSAGCEPSIEAVRVVHDKEHWAAIEREVIAAMRTAGVRLVNGTDGGEGVRGRVWTPSKELRQRIAEKQKGKKASPETCAKRSASLRAYYAGNPEALALRRAMGAAAGRSVKSRELAAKRMTEIWSNPERAEAMRQRMRAAWAKKKAPLCA